MMSPSQLVDVNNSILLIIDIQTRLCAAMPDSPREKMLTHTNILCEAATSLNIPVLYTEQYPKGLGHTENILLTSLGDIKPIEKTCFSCCDADDFMFNLAQNKQKQVIICGMETHVCVLQTAMQLLDNGYSVFIVEDAVMSRHSLHHHNALSRMKKTDIIISNYESVLFEWLRDASHPAFKFLAKFLH
ncbi:MAG: hydrolase [Gammaproteobacteria bacterium]|nr:hydrolase [Gammaproteobacteria bacterium]